MPIKETFLCIRAAIVGGSGNFRPHEPARHRAQRSRLLRRPSPERCAPRGRTTAAVGRLQLLFGVAVLAFGCAPSALEPQRPTSRAVFVEIQERVTSADMDLAYAKLASFREQFPSAEEDRQAFRLAADVYRRLYFRDRYTRPDAVWVRETPTWLFEWFESFFGEGASGSFPRDDADALFLGHHYGFVRQFQAWAETSAILSAWDLSFETDNGRILSVAGTPRVRSDGS